MSFGWLSPSKPRNLRPSSQPSLEDFFTEVDAIQKGDLSHGAKLRFAHFEIVAPFVALLGLDGSSQSQPLAAGYSYQNNPWRAEIVSPMAGNIQWDVARDASGVLAVKMLHNEKEVNFKTACDPARRTGSHFYDYAQLKTCYGHTAKP